MFFYGEQDAVLQPTVILNGFSANLPVAQSTTLNLLNAQNGDLLVVYSHRSSLHEYNVPHHIISSSISNNWSNLPDTRTGSVTIYGGSPYLSYYYNCSGQNNGTVSYSSPPRGQTYVVMKKLTSAEISGQVKVNCFQGNISYLLIRNVNTFDIHKNTSGVALRTVLSQNWGSTTLNWPIANTNINANTQKLFICGIRGSGTQNIAGVSNISQNGVNSLLFQLDKQQLTGASIPIVCTRTATEVANSAAYAGFLGMVIT